MTIQPDNLSGFVVALGMPRGGSTTLYHQLSQHPSVALPIRKEAHYFSVHYDRGRDWFLSLYGRVGPDQVAFDIGAGYFFDEQSIGRILQLDHRTRAILCVREPISWALSLYRQLASQIPSMPTFDEFVHGYRPHEQSAPLDLTQRFVTRTLSRCRDAFGENLLVYDFELFRRHPLQVLQAIESFAGLSPHFGEENFENVLLNASNRHHSVYLNAVLNNERFLAVFHRVLPRRILRFAREKYYLSAVNRQPSSPRDRHSKEDIVLAESLFWRRARQDHCSLRAPSDATRFWSALCRATISPLGSRSNSKP